MNQPTTRTLLIAVLCGGLLLSACGGGDDQVVATPLSAPATEGYPIETGGPGEGDTAAPTEAIEGYPMEEGASVDPGSVPSPAEGYPAP
ncbi:MAG TPA: hypothetical protein PLC98_17660 [Anaerolineales bacterium]|nr:hypothetical protein [Anaerolineales bacterium]